MAVKGLWNIGGFNTPDFGISEKLSGLSPKASSQGGLFGGLVPNNSAVYQTPNTFNSTSEYGFTPTVPQQQSSFNISTSQGPLAPTPQPQPQPTGQVQGTQTQNNGDQGPTVNDQLQGGYNDLNSQLDQMLAGLGGQASNLTNIANQQTTQQQNSLDLQNTQSENTLNQYQDKSLKNIGETIAAGMRAGNNMLGSVGAGDSSAANQYSYALTKEGSKQRGAVTQEISQRLGNLKMVYNTAKNNLVSGLNQRVSEISQWFAEQQNQIKGMKADAAKQYSDQALKIAMGQLQMAQQQIANQRNVLDTWVANNATSIQQVQQGLQQNAQNLPMPTAFNTQPQVNSLAANRLFSQNNTTEKAPTLFNNNNNWLT